MHLLVTVRDRLLANQEAIMGSAKAVKFIMDFTNAKVEVINKLLNFTNAKIEVTHQLLLKVR